LNTGNEIVKVVPSFTLDSTSICLPYNRTNLFTIAGPRPGPAVGFVESKGSKISGRFFSSIPVAVSIF
jgi:hypothetical protein